MKVIIFFCSILSCLLLQACGFRMSGPLPLAPRLHHLYLQTSDPYSTLSRQLTEYLKISNVSLVSSPEQASAILVILNDVTSQDFLSVSGTQQVRQYNLKVSVTFEVTDAKGKILVPPQTLIESRPITIEANQILGSSNETSLFYQQMRRTLALAILNRLASKQITHLINTSL